jgi:hypothetical protein
VDRQNPASETSVHERTTRPYIPEDANVRGSTQSHRFQPHVEFVSFLRNGPTIGSLREVKNTLRSTDSDGNILRYAGFFNGIRMKVRFYFLEWLILQQLKFVVVGFSVLYSLDRLGSAQPLELKCPESGYDLSPPSNSEIRIGEGREVTYGA